MATFDAESVKIDDMFLEGDQVNVIVSSDIQLVSGATETVRVIQRYWFRRDGKVSRIESEAADDQEEFDRLIEQARRL
jgi:hypothetical protein